MPIYWEKKGDGIQKANSNTEENDEKCQLY